MIQIKISGYLGHLVVGLHCLCLLLILKKLLVLLLLLLSAQTAPILIISRLGNVHEVGDDVNGDWEDDGGVMLGANAVQSLQIPELEQEKE